MTRRSSDQVLQKVHGLFNFGALGTMSDAQLLERFVTQGGDVAEAAFEELIVRHGPMVCRVCSSILHNVHDAEDAFQAVFLVLANQAASIRRHRSIASWLFGVAQRVALRSKRTAARRRARDARAALRTVECAGPVEIDADSEILHEEIQALPGALRTLVVLCYLQDLTHEMAAVRLGLSSAAVRGRLARARARLQRRLVRRGVTVPAGLFIVGASSHAQAAVPVTLVQSTTRIALGFAAGNTAAHLARGMVRSILWNRLRVATIVACLGVGGSYSAWYTVARAGDGKSSTHRREDIPTVQIVRPPVRTIVRTIGQPSFIESRQRTAIYPRFAGHIEKPLVDIGDKVKKGDALATLFVPDVLKAFEAKKAAIDLATERIKLRREVVKATEREMTAVQVQLREAHAILETFQAEVDQCDEDAGHGAVEREARTERRQSAVAARDGARSTVRKLEAELRTQQASLAQAKVDLSVAQAELAAARSEAKQLEAWAHSLSLPPDRRIVAATAVREAAKARVDATHSQRDTYVANVAQWAAEVDRLKAAVDSQTLLKPIEALKPSDAVRDAARSAIEQSNSARTAATMAIQKAEAALRAYRTSLAGARVDAALADAELAVAECEEARVKEWLAAFTVTAPHEGVIVARNANTGDLVRPGLGQRAVGTLDRQTALPSPTALYVIDQTDRMCVYVAVPEQDARYVHVGSKATVRVKAYSEQPIPARVTRVSWAANVKNRTLRAEIELSNPDGGLMPGMYAFAQITIERRDVRALPTAAVETVGDKTYCWTYERGKAVQTAIQTGLSDGKWIEVWHRARSASVGAIRWAPLDGSESVILGDLSALEDATPVQLAPKAEAPESSRFPDEHESPD